MPSRHCTGGKLKYNRTALAAAGIGLATAMILTGCGPSAPTPKSSNSASSTAVITTNGSEPQNPLIPTNTNETGGGKILDAMFAGLVYYDEKGAPQNDVAESITTKDNTTYTIKIKPGQKFTNDEPVTAESFVKAWKYGALASNAQLSSYFFEDIEGFSYDADTDLTGLKVVNDTTFTVTLTSALADFPLRLGYSAFFPLPESAWKDLKAFGQNPIGNGPYMFASPTAWQHNVKLDLKINPAYDGGRKAHNGGLTFTFYANQGAAYSDLLANNLDVLDAIPDSAFGTYQKDLGDRAVNQPAAIFQSFTIPDRLAHFSGQEGILRRQALSMAINRPEITKVIFQDTRTPASDFTSPVIDGWTNKLKGADVLGAPYPTFKEARTLITNRTIQTAFRTGWQADYPGLFNFLGPIYGTKAGSNDGDYSNPKFDALLKKGSTETDLKAANKEFQQAQEILLKDLPAIPLWYSNVTGGYGTDVQNVHFGWNSVPLYYEITKKGK